MAAWNPRANELFLNALDLASPDERQAYLASACGEDASLRQAVEALLKAHAAAGNFLEPKADHARQPDTMAMESPREGAGATIGNYKLLQLIGEGGFGSVFMAEQEKPVRRRVALKIIKLGMDTRQVIARFEAERQALAMMDHTHIARVFDAGTTDTGRPYFVMELVRGVPITEYCDTHHLSTRERLELFIPVCNAVQHAHQKGIIHRDIKPSNVMVTLADGKPIPKIIDFGIAKATNARLTEQTYFTEYHQLIGTPEYMSPEQAEMTGIDIDTRSDIYSLGVLLYVLLTGTTPFDARKLRSLAYEEMQRTIREVEPPIPSKRLSGLSDTAAAIATHRKTEPRRLEQMLRGELDWIVMRALEKDRTRRYDTSGNLADDIRRHLDNEPVLARPPSTVYRLRKFVSKHRFGVLACTAVLMALLVGLTLATVGFVRAKSERDIAEKARIDAQAQRDIANEARIEAQAQKKVAEDQKQSAFNSARKAELRFADGLVSQAHALSLANRFAEAHPLYALAYDKFSELKEPLTAAEVGLWSSYHQTGFPLLNFAGHNKVVLGVAISPDGRTGLSASDDHTLKLWDLASGRELRTFSGHAETVYCVAFAPNGHTALSGSVDKTMKLWDVANGKVIRTFTGHSGTVQSVVFARNGLTALSGSADRTLKLWDLASGKVLRTFTGHMGGVATVAISPDGQTALSGSDDRTLKLWNLATGKEVRPFDKHGGDVSSVAFSPDGLTAISATGVDVELPVLKLWDVATGKQLRTFTGHSAGVAGVAFLPDGKTVLSGSWDKTLKLWDVSTGKELRTFTGHAKPVSGIAISPDGLTAISGSIDEFDEPEEKNVKLWNLAGGKELRTLLGHRSLVTSVAYAPDGRTAISGSWDGTLRLWDLASGKLLNTFAGHEGIVNGVAFAPDGRTALSASADKTVKLWDLGSGKELRTFTGHTDHVLTVAFAPDGQTALSGSSDNTLKLWDLASGKLLRTFTGHDAWVSSVIFARDGRTALSGSWDSTLRLWDVETGKTLRTFRSHTLPVLSVALSPDGRTALSGGYDNSLKLWDLASGTVLRTFTGHTHWVNSVAFAPDGRIALSGSVDETRKLWDLASGEELRTFAEDAGQVFSVAFAPGGQSALSGNNDGTITLYDFARGSAQRAFEPRVAEAQATLQHSANDPAALATLGEWYAFQGLDQWAVEFLGRARENGAAVAPLTLARCYWNLDQLTDARREFHIALDQSKDPAEQSYLGWCIASIDREVELKTAEPPTPAQPRDTQPATTTPAAPAKAEPRSGH